MPDPLGRSCLFPGDAQDCVTVVDVCIVRPGHDGVSTPWLSHFINAPQVRSAIHRLQSGSTRKRISRSNLGTVKLLIPPTNEQHRIVSAIDSYITRLDDAVATLERVQRNLKRYRASVLKAAVEGRLVPTEAELARAEGRSYEPASVLLERILAERRRRWEEAELAKMTATGKAPKDDRWKAKYVEPVAPDTSELPELPQGWCWASMEAITSAVRVICYGILMPKDHVPDGVPYVKVRDMRPGRLDVSFLQRTSPEIAAKFERATLRAGDLLLAIRGTYGRVVDVPPELEGGNITQDTARLDVASGVDTRYVKALLLSPGVQALFRRVARGVAVKGVNITDVRATPIALPPYAEQQRIAQELDNQLSLVDAAYLALDANEWRCTRLRQSILKWAFEGRLVDQDPTDEPASVLLERIRAERASATDKPPRRARSARAAK